MKSFIGRGFVDKTLQQTTGLEAPTKSSQLGALDNVSEKVA